MNSKWFSFKLISSLLLLVMTTIWTCMYETSVNYDLWFCIWALCVVRFVDVVDDLSGGYKKVNEIVGDSNDKD